MHPTIVEIGPLALHSYGFLLAVSFFAGIWLAARRAPRRGLSVEMVYDTSLVIVFAAILGARLMYVLFHREEIRSFIDVIAVWRGGLTMYGGVIAAMISAWLYLRRRETPFLRMADVMAPSLGFGLMLTRIGCFLNGCCYGKPTDMPWGLALPAETFGGRLFGESPLHPTQLYSSLEGLGILILLLLYDRRPRREGQVFALYLVLSGIGRFTLDFFRYYEANVYVAGPLTVNQLISLGACLLGVLLFAAIRGSRVIGTAVLAAKTGEASSLPSAQ
jgi:phosphatidylglycerol---prolipoprotein diacylglyceryl transferase